MKKKLLIGLIILFAGTTLAQGQFGLGFKKSRLRMNQIYSDSLFTITLRADTLRGWNQDTVYVNSRLILNEGITIRQTVDNEFMVTADGDTIRLNAYQALKAFQIEVGNVDQAWVDTTGIGYLRSKLGINTITPDDQAEIVNAAANAVLDITAYHDTEATTPLISLRKGEGTEASHASPVDDNAVLGTLSFKGYDTDGWIEGARIQGIANGTPADGVMPTDLEFYTNTGGATATLVWTIEEDGDLISNLASGVINHTGATLFTVTSVADIEITTTSNNEDIKLIPNGSGDVVITSAGLVLSATENLYFDGEGDTYIEESAADVLDVQVGGVKAVSITESTVTISGDFEISDHHLLVTGGAYAERTAMPWSGTGTYMFFDPDSGSFSGGYITDAAYVSEDSVGNVSFAYGVNAVASGMDGSIAMGWYPRASGVYSLAIGYSTDASGNYAVALGDNTTASGTQSTAMGDDCIASGIASFAVGDDCEATGNTSIAMGSVSKAVGSGGIAIGSNSEANGAGSVAIGTYNFSEGNKSFALGNSSIVSGNSSWGINLGNFPTFGDTLKQNNTMAITEGKIGLGTVSPGTTLEIAGGNGSAAHPLLTIVNNDTTLTTETGQTSDVIFEFLGSSNGGVAYTNQEAGKLSSYKIADYYHASDETDQDAGLKLYTVTDGAYVLNSTFSGDDLATVGTISAATYGSNGSVSDAELLYVDATSSIQTQLDARLLEVDFGDSLVNYDGDGIKVTDNDAIDILVDYNGGIEIVDDSLNIKAASVTNAMLAGSIDLTSKVTGTLPEANGGTGDTDLDDIVGGDGLKATDGANTIIGGNSTLEVLVDYNGGIEIGDDSLNVKLDGVTLTLSTSGLKVTDDTYQPLDANLTNLATQSHAVGDLLYAASATTYSKLADVAAGQPLLSGGVTTAPAYAGYTFSGTAAQTYTFPGSSASLAPLTSPLFTTSIAIGDAVINEAELEKIDDLTTTKTQLNYLSQSTGTTGTATTNIVFSTSPAITTPTIQTEMTAQGATDASLAFIMEADQGADNADTWQILIADGDEFALQAYAGGSYTDALTIVGSTLAADFVGALAANTITSDATVKATTMIGHVAQQTITLGNGAVTFAVTSNVVTVTGDGGANVIATITGAEVGLYTFIFVDGLVTISNDDGHGANTIDLEAAGDFTSADDSTLQLIFDGTSWYQTGEVVN